MLFKSVLSTLLVSSVIFVVSSCRQDESPVAPRVNQIADTTNHPPVILSVALSTDTIHGAKAITVTCNAVDADNDSLKYTWNDGENANHQGDGKMVNLFSFACCAHVAYFEVVVEDGRGGIASK